jgi:hypothetical protein
MKFSKIGGLLQEQDSTGKRSLTKDDLQVMALLKWLEENGENEVTANDISEIGEFYYLSQYEVDGVNGSFTVGDDYDMLRSSRESIEQMIDDLGYESFNLDFVKAHLNEKRLIKYAYEYFSEDVYNYPEGYFEDSQRMLSSKQDEEVEILERKKSRIERTKQQFENMLGGENDEWAESKIQDIEEILSDLNLEIEEIKSNPEGDFSDDLIDEQVEISVGSVRDNPWGFIEDLNINFEEFIDKDDFIQEIIDVDGYGHVLNSYDGNADEVYVNGDLFYVMRID